MPENPVIDFEKVTISREGKWALHDVRWRVLPGEHWFILGNNGSGKTTLLELLMGYLWPDSGSICVQGNTYGETDLREVRSFFGHVSSWLLDRMRPEIPVEHVVASGAVGVIGRLSSIPAKLRASVYRELRFFEMEVYAKRPYGTLSSGQKTRVLLARALIHNPAILVLDEPFAHLDVQARLKIYGFLDRLAKHRKTVSIILVTHHLQDVLPFFTHGILLGKGSFSALPREEALSRKNLCRTFSIPSTLAKYLS